jgi:hypothetical protein
MTKEMAARLSVMSQCTTLRCAAAAAMPAAAAEAMPGIEALIWSDAETGPQRPQSHTIIGIATNNVANEKPAAAPAEPA